MCQDSRKSDKNCSISDFLNVLTTHIHTDRHQSPTIKAPLAISQQQR